MFDDIIVDQHCFNRKSECVVSPWIRRVGICSRLWYPISWNIGFKKKWLPSDSKLNFVFEWIHSNFHLFLPNPTPWSDYITHYINIYYRQCCHISFINWKWHSFQNRLENFVLIFVHILWPLVITLHKWIKFSLLKTPREPIQSKFCQQNFCCQIFSCWKVNRVNNCKYMSWKV